MLTVGLDPADVHCGETWAPTGEVVPPATDDRPFVYLKTPSIPSRYLWTLGLILIASAVAVRFAGGRIGAMRGYLDLFFMGAGFLLLETKSVVQFALLFGTTWFVNALVFAGILLTILAAIEVERRTHIRRPNLLFPVLFVGLLVAGLVPGSWLLSLDTVPRFLAASVLAFFPVFIANLVFAGRFRDTADPTTAFGANLLGAMLGGVLEYLSLITGYRGLLVIAGLLYALAWIFGARKLARSTDAVPGGTGAGARSRRPRRLTGTDRAHIPSVRVSRAPQEAPARTRGLEHGHDRARTVVGFDRRPARPRRLRPAARRARPGARR